MGTMTEQMDIAMERANVKVEDLPRETRTSTMRLVGVKTDNVAPGVISVPAIAPYRQQGVMLISPRLEEVKRIRGTLELARTITAVMWACDPARRRKGSKELSHPSIAPTHRLLLKCSHPGCDHTEDLCWDESFRKHSDQTRNLRGAEAAFKALASKRPKGRKRGRNNGPMILCESCFQLSKPRASLMHVTHLPTAVLPSIDRGRPVHNICAGHDDPLVKQMFAKLHGDIPDGPDGHFLDLIYAVYIRGMTPTDHPVRDPVGMELDKRLAAKEYEKNGKKFTYTVRPGRVAFEVKGGGATVRNFLLGASAEWRWGWVSEDDLVGKTDIGYTRRYLNPSAIADKDDADNPVNVAL